MIVDSAHLSGRGMPLWLVFVSLLCGTAAVVAESESTGHYSVVAVFGLLLALGVAGTMQFLPRNNGYDQYELRAFLAAYAISSLWVVGIGWYFRALSGDSFTPALFGSNPDDRKYYDIGVLIADGWQATGTAFQLDHYAALELQRFKYKGFPYLVGAVTYISDWFGDRNGLTFRLVSSFATALISVYVYRLGTLAFDRVVAQRATLLSIFFPIWSYYAALGTRDTLIALLLLVVIYNFLLLTQRGRPIIRHGADFLILAGAMLGLYFLRHPTVLAVLGALGAWVFTEWIRTKHRVSFLPVVLVFLVLLSVSQWLLPGTGLESSVAQADRYSQAILETGENDSLSRRLVFSLPELLRFPASVIYTIFIPIPPIKSWHLHHVALGLAASIWYFMVPFWLYGMWKGKGNRVSNLLTITSLVLLLAVAYVVPSVRHKTQLLPFALIHTAFATHLLGQRSLLMGLAMLMLVAMVGVIYVALKFT